MDKNIIFENFNDIYIPIYNPNQTYVQPGMHFVNNGEKNEMFDGLIELIKSRYNEEIKVGRYDFSVFYEGDHRRYRCHVNPSINGNYVNARRMPEKAWTLDECFETQDSNVKTYLKEYLLSNRLSKGGLILVCGTPGNGKSTTCAAIVYDRLKKLGGHCNTVEDPVEMPLHGSIGDKGYCIQREIYGKESFSEAVRDTLRGYPTNVNNILLIGEIRDAGTAELVIRAAIDGRLVVSTVHAESVVAAIRQLLSHASKSSLGKDQAEDLLANSLRAVIHQNLIGKTGLALETLFDTDSVAGSIREGSANLNQLENEISRQAINISKGEPVIPRDLESSKKMRKKIRRQINKQKDPEIKKVINKEKTEIKNQPAKKKKFLIFG